MATMSEILSKLELKEARDYPFSRVLDYIGFQLTSASPSYIEGRFVVSETSAQKYGVLHGGISAFIAESLASFGGFLASGGQRVAGVDLSITHLQSAPIGTQVEVKVTPLHVGRKLQIWEVNFFAVGYLPENLKTKESSTVKRPKFGLIARSKLTVTVVASKHEQNSSGTKVLISKL